MRGAISRRPLAKPSRRVPWLVLLLLVWAPVPSTDAYELVCQPEAYVTTVAGCGVFGFRDGVAGRASFHSPSGVVQNPNTDEVFVSDSGNNRVRKMDLRTHEVVTVVGGGSSTEAGFDDGPALRSVLNDPQGLVFSEEGLLFIADRGNHRIRAVDFSVNGVWTYAGSGLGGYADDADPLLAQIKSPTGLAYHDATKTLYVTDGDHRVRGIHSPDDPNGAGGVFTLANAAGLSGFSDSQFAQLATFASPSFMTWNEQQTTLFVADRMNHAIRAITFGNDDDDHRVYTVAGTGFVPLGNTSLASDGSGVGGISFNEPVGVAYFVEPSDVGDTGDHGNLSAQRNGSTPGRETLFVTEFGANRVRRIVLNGDVAGSFGSGEVASFPYAGSYVAHHGHDDALGPAALFSSPIGTYFPITTFRRLIAITRLTLFFLQSGVLVSQNTNGSVAFVADSDNHVLRRLQRKLSTKVRVLVEAVDTTTFGNNERQFLTHSSKKDSVLDTYGHYSINGPPHNETTHVFGAVTFVGETHDFAMCLYRDQEYFAHFVGALRVLVADDFVFQTNNLATENTYIKWTGNSIDSTRSENFKLRAPGCTDPGSPNFDPYATFDDGTCQVGTSLKMEIKSLGGFGFYKIEGPGFYYESDLSAADPEDDGDEDVHVISFAAYRQAPYTIQMHGALSFVVVDAVSEQTQFTYLNHTSRHENSHRIETIRPAGPGCTQPKAVNYSPFAIEDDGSCVAGRFLRIDSVSGNAEDAVRDWFEFGAVSTTQPLLLGDHAVLTPVLFTSENATATQTVYLAPGKYPVDLFGLANATFTEVRLELDGGEQILLVVDGGDASLKLDPHGFASTLGGARAYLSIAGFDDEVDLGQSVDSFILGVGDGAAVSGLAVANLSALATRNVLSDFTSTGTPRGSWDFVSQVWQPSPLRKKVDFLVSITFPYDKEKVPTVKGNSELQVIRASDETASDWRVVRDAVFDHDKKTVTVKTDTFSLFAVVTKAVVRQISVPENGRVRPNGGLLTIDGVDFRVPPANENVTGTYFCKLGDLLTQAQFTESKELRGFGDAVTCPTPPMSNGKAHFVAVEVYDASTFQSSASDLRVLLTAPPDVKSVLPNSGPDTGGCLVVLTGAYLGAGANSFDSQVSAVTCFFGDFEGLGGTVPGVTVSSALAICETPEAADTDEDRSVRVGVTSDGVRDARNAAYTYRTPIIDLLTPGTYDLLFSEDHGAEGALNYYRGSASGGSVVTLDLLDGFDGSSPDLACAFGSTRVDARVVNSESEKHDCVVPGKWPGTVQIFIAGSVSERNLHFGVMAYHNDKPGTSSYDIGFGNTEEDDLPLSAYFSEPGGNFGARLDVSSGSFSDRFSDRFSLNALTCFLGGLPSEFGVSSTGHWLDCGWSGTGGGFVAVSVSRNGPTLAGTDTRRVGQISLPSRRDAPKLLSVVNGPNLLTATGSVFSVVGSNLIAFGSGGQLGTEENAGFGFGNDGGLVCSFERTDDFGKSKNTKPNSNSKPRNPQFARVVSSALATCETPGFLYGGDFFDQFLGGRLIETRVGIGSKETWRKTRDTKTESWTNTTGHEVSVVVVSSFSVTSVSGVNNGNGVRNEHGGAEVSVAWSLGGGGSGLGSGSGSWLVSNPDAVACAFGSVFPIAARRDESKNENKARCFSPARRNFGTRKSETILDENENWFSVVLVGGARATRDVSLVGDGDSHSDFPESTLSSSWTPLPSAVSGFGGSAIFIAGWVPENFACLFPDAAGGSTFVESLGVPGSSSKACTTSGFRGGFVTLGLGLGDPMIDSNTDHQRVIETYAVSVATSFFPSSVNRDGGVLWVTGRDFAASFEQNAVTHCVFENDVTVPGVPVTVPGVLVTVPGIQVSSVLQRCEVPDFGGFSGRRETKRERDEKAVPKIGVSVARGVDAHSFSGLLLEVHETPVVVHVTPSVLPAHGGGGGSLVAVDVIGISIGLNLENQRNVRCAFGTIRIAVSFLNSNAAAECVAPTHGAGVVDFAITHEGDTRFDGGAKFTFVT